MKLQRDCGRLPGRTTCEGTVAPGDFERKFAESLIDFIENFLCDFVDFLPNATVPPSEVA